MAVPEPVVKKNHLASAREIRGRGNLADLCGEDGSDNRARVRGCERITSGAVSLLFTACMIRTSGSCLLDPLRKLRTE
jgi:hypothetical protein